MPHSHPIICARRNKKVMAAVVAVAVVAMWGVSLTPLGDIIGSKLDAIYVFVFKVSRTP